MKNTSLDAAYTFTHRAPMRLLHSHLQIIRCTDTAIGGMAITYSLREDVKVKVHASFTTSDIIHRWAIDAASSRLTTEKPSARF